MAERKAQSQRDKAVAKQRSVGLGANNEGNLLKPGAKRRNRRKAAKGFPANGGAGKQVSVAAAYATGQRSKAPVIVASRDSSRIIHRELIYSVIGSDAFTVQQTFALNPGLAATFPWLSTQAQSWEAYRFNKLKFCAYTRTGSAIPGSLMLVPDYDAADAAPISEQVASAYEDVSEDVPWKDVECELLPAAMHSLGPRKFIRTGPLAANEDVKTYDVGNLFVCTVDGTAVKWSKLWVEYDVTLFTPQLPPGGGSSAFLSEHITGTSPTTGANFANPVVSAGSSNLVTISGNVLTFTAAGKWMINEIQNASTSTTYAANPTIGGGGSLVTTFASPNGYTPGGVTNAVASEIETVVGSTYTWPCTIVGGTSWELLISPVPANQV